MVGMSDYSARKVLDHLVGKTSFTMPATVYLALFTVLPSDANAGATEVSGGSYARIQTNSPATNWNAAAGSAPASTSNNVDFTFATASADWGTVIGWGLFDASTVGNLL